MSDRITAPLLAVCDLTRAKWADETVRYAVAELGEYQERDVLNAIRRCAKECKFPVTLADIVDRLAYKPATVPYHRPFPEAGEDHTGQAQRGHLGRNEGHTMKFFLDHPAMSVKVGIHRKIAFDLGTWMQNVGRRPGMVGARP